MARRPAEHVKIEGPTGKQLSALLQILRAAGVTEYAVPGVTIKLGPDRDKTANQAQPLESGSAQGVTVSHLDGEDEEPADDEVRYALEARRPLMTKLIERHFPTGTDRERALGRNGSGT